MKAVLSVLVLGMLSACTQVNPVAHSAPAALSAYPLHHYTQPLSEQLFAQLSTQRSLTDGIAVASFLPLNSLTLQQADDPERQLANQLAESMLVHARQYGLKVYDYRLRNEVLLAADHEQALSRQLSDIETNSDADTLLVGTYSAMEDGYLVNARLISILDKQVLAAASGYVPHNVLWSQQQVGKRGDKLYRQDRTGEQK